MERIPMPRQNKIPMHRTTISLLLLTTALSPVFAQRTERGSLHVTATVEGSIRVVFKAIPDIERIVTGTTSASFSMPTLGGAFTTNPTMSPAPGGGVLISSPFEITVIKANLMSASYALKARLVTPDLSRSWTVDGIDISNGRQRELSSSQTYGEPMTHSLLVRSAAETTEKIGLNQIDFQVIVN
jgi:hypothetical protein